MVGHAVQAISGKSGSLRSHTKPKTRHSGTEHLAMGYITFTTLVSYIYAADE